MARKRNPNELLSELDELAEDPAAQSRYAVELLAAERRAQLVGPAVRAIERFPFPEARPALLSLYADLDANGVRLDAGGTFRAGILRALRSWATVDDLGLLERAVTTYEFLPPGRSEVADPIRAAGLIALADLDPQLAGFHAARMLVDHEHTSPFSGEPARTAAEVLAALSQQLALYLYTLRGQQRDDVTAECLRRLADVPDSIAVELWERFDAEAAEAAQIGVVDMLLARPNRRLFRDELERRLHEPMPPAVFRYLAVAAVAGRDDALIGELDSLLHVERDPYRRLILEEALALAPARTGNAKTQRRKGKQ